MSFITTTLEDYKRDYIAGVRYWLSQSKKAKSNSERMENLKMANHFYKSALEKEKEIRKGLR